jgi:phage baseplate assembly protein W
MSAIVKEAIAAELALLTTAVPTPVEPFGYGTDTSGVDDWTDTLDDVDAFSALGISQALARRLQTPRGTLQDDGSYGLDLRAYVNRPTATTELRTIESQVRGEVLKDDRIVDAVVTVALFASLKLLRVQINCTAADPHTGGPFRLTLAVTDGALLLEAVNVAA